MRTSPDHMSGTPKPGCQAGSDLARHLLVAIYSSFPGGVPLGPEAATAEGAPSSEGVNFSNHHSHGFKPSAPSAATEIMQPGPTYRSHFECSGSKAGAPDALFHIMAFTRAILEDMYQVHPDSGGELTYRTLRRCTRKQLVWQTNTQGHDPEACQTRNSNDTQTHAKMRGTFWRLPTSPVASVQPQEKQCSSKIAVLRNLSTSTHQSQTNPSGHSMLHMTQSPAMA